EYYYADHINAILGVYTELDEVTNLQCDYMELLEKCKGLETELSKSKMMSKSFKSVQKHAINLELELQQCKEKIKNDKSFKVNQTKDFCKEREQYFEIQDLKAQLQDKGIVIRVIPTTSVSRPQLKSNPQGDRVLHNSSQAKKHEVEDQRRNVKLSTNKMYVTACNDNLNAKTLNVKSVYAMCDKCVLIDKHNMCVLNSVARPIKRTVASESNKKPRNFTMKLYERVSKTCSWWKSTCFIRDLKGNGLLTDQLSSDPTPECQSMALNHDSLSLANQRQANVPQADRTVVSKSFAVSAADAPNQRQQLTTPLNNHTTTAPTCQVPTVVPTVISSEKINQAKMYAKNDQVADDEFINIFSTPVQDQGETSSHHVDSSNMHTFYQRFPSEHRWTKDHPLEQVIGNPSQSVRTRRQLESNAKMCMFVLTVSRTEPKNIKEAMDDSAWIESMQEELYQFDRLDEKGDECIFVGYSTQSRAYRVFNKRTRVIMESIHVNFDELSQMASDQISSDPALECQKMALKHDSLSPAIQRQANVPQADRTVTTSKELDLLFSPMFDGLLNGSSKFVSKSSNVSAADAPNQRQHHTTPLNIHTTPAPTCQVPTLAPTVISFENINQAETYAENDQVADDEFINILSTLVQDQGETSSRHVDSTRRQLESNDEMCMFALTVSRTEPTNIKEAMADSAWIESMQEELHQFDRLDEFRFTNPLVVEVLFRNSDSPILSWYIYKPSQVYSRDTYKACKVGALMYLTASRPNIMHATCCCARYQAQPTEKHLTMIKRIFRYLKDTIHMGLWYLKDTGFELTAFSDSDHAGCLDSHKSKSGGIQFLGGDKLVSWSSKKLDCTSMSSAEAEYVSLSACFAQAAITVSCNPVQHSCTKHIDVRYHFIKEKVEKGIVELFFVGTKYQLADLFNKALPVERFKYLVRRLGMRCLTLAELEALANESA
nr:retrovirus-related Pol polyprotein from transposon TNT 1-94 [Tanacetum cinerariifolium]